MCVAEISNVIMQLQKAEELVLNKEAPKTRIPVTMVQLETWLFTCNLFVEIMNGVLGFGWTFKCEHTGISILRSCVHAKAELSNYRKFYYEFKFDLHRKYSADKVDRILLGLEPWK